MCFISLEDFFLVSLGFSLKLQIGVVLELEAIGPGVLSVAWGGGGSWTDMEPRYPSSWDRLWEGALPCVSCCTEK